MSVCVWRRGGGGGNVQSDSVVRVVDSAVREEENGVLPVTEWSVGRVDGCRALHAINHERWDHRDIDATKLRHRLHWPRDPTKDDLRPQRPQKHPQNVNLIPGNTPHTHVREVRQHSS
jgi:hypothetical protein